MCPRRAGRWFGRSRTRSASPGSRPAPSTTRAPACRSPRRAAVSRSRPPGPGTGGEREHAAFGTAGDDDEVLGPFGGVPSSLMVAVGFGWTGTRTGHPRTGAGRNASTWAGIPAAASATSVCVMSIVHPSPNGNDRIVCWCRMSCTHTADHPSTPPPLGFGGRGASLSASRGSSSTVA